MLEKEKDKLTCEYLLLKILSQVKRISRKDRVLVDQIISQGFIELIYTCYVIVSEHLHIGYDAGSQHPVQRGAGSKGAARSDTGVDHVGVAVQVRGDAQLLLHLHQKLLCLLPSKLRNETQSYSFALHTPSTR